VLNRPDVLNALNGTMIAALRDSLRNLTARADVRVLLLAGSGRGFCAGIDLRDEAMNLDAPAEERGARLAEAFDSGVNALMRNFAAFSRPKIAVVNGPAVGGSAGLALAADIVVAAQFA
jgi:enoyl-CoA hydratase/carnithine racemase